VLFTERGSPLEVPIRPAWHTLYALWLLCGMTGKEGRKTHAETIDTVDATADGARADCDVLCIVAHG